MSGISNRIFGADIRTEIKQKLALRQELNKNANFGEAVTNVSKLEYGGESFGINKAKTIYKTDYTDSSDLSSRTPFVRMWTAVQAVDSDENHYETQIYEVGNHIYNTFKQDGNILDTRVGASSGDIAKHIFPNVHETQTLKTQIGEPGVGNDFMAPPSGITNFNSSTEDSMGLTLKTTISFTVNNFHDFDKIYNKFFLKPGAKIFVDYGWSTSKLYNPYDIITDSGRNRLGEDIKDKTSVNGILYGVGGFVTNSYGDMETIIGLVTNYNAKVDGNGSIKCTIDIISQNNSLLSTNFDEDENQQRKKRIIHSLDKELIKLAATAFGDEVSKEIASADWTNNFEDEQGWSYIFNKWAFKSLTTESGSPEKEEIEAGVFWAGKDENDSSIFISYAVFEDFILNTEFGFSDSEDTILSDDDSIRFDSTNTLIRWSRILWKKQGELGDKLSNRKFVYPSLPYDSDVQTFNSKMGKLPEIFVNDQLYDYTKVDLGNGDKLIPIREIFISLDMVRKAITESDNVQQIVEFILEKINDDSKGVFDLKIGTNSYDNKNISIIDRNLPFHDVINENNDENFMKNLFLFKPSSPNSIVQSYDLDFSMPGGRMGDMLAIQASSNTTGSIIPVSNDLDKLISVGAITSIDKINSKNFGFQYLPKIGKHVSSRIGESSKISGLDLGYSNHLQDFENNNQIKKALNNLSDRDSEVISGLITNVGKEEQFIDENNRKLKRTKSVDDSDALKEEIEDNVIVASSLEKYYDKQIKSGNTNHNSSLLPIKLTMSIYGISSLNVGDVFTVDYLPEVYRENVYFQIVKVTNAVDDTGWKTQLESQMRIRPAKKKKTTPYEDKTVVLNKSVLTVSKRFSGYDDDIWPANVDMLKESIKSLVPGPTIKTTHGYYVNSFKCVGLKNSTKFIGHKKFIDSGISSYESSPVDVWKIKKRQGLSEAFPDIWKSINTNVDAVKLNDHRGIKGFYHRGDFKSPPSMAVDKTRYSDYQELPTQLGKNSVTAYYAWKCKIKKGEPYLILYTSNHWIVIPQGSIKENQLRFFADVLWGVNSTEQTTKGGEFKKQNKFEALEALDEKSGLLWWKN